MVPFSQPQKRTLKIFICLTLICQMFVGSPIGAQNKSKVPKKIDQAVPAQPAVDLRNFGGFWLDKVRVFDMLKEIMIRHPDLTLDIGQPASTQTEDNMDSFINYKVSFKTLENFNYTEGAFAMQDALSRAQYMGKGKGELGLKFIKYDSSCPQPHGDVVIVPINAPENFCQSNLLSSIDNTNKDFSKYAVKADTRQTTFTSSYFNKPEGIENFRKLADTYKLGIEDVHQRELGGKPLALSIIPTTRGGAATIVTNSPMLMATLADSIDDLNKPGKALPIIRYNVEFRELTNGKNKTASFSLAALLTKYKSSFTALVGGTTMNAENSMFNPQPSISINRSNFSSVISNLNGFSSAELTRQVPLQGTIGMPVTFKQGGTFFVNIATPTTSSNSYYNPGYATTVEKNYGLDLTLNATPTENGTFQLEIEYKNSTPSKDGTQSTEGKTTVSIQEDEVLMIAGSMYDSHEYNSSRGFIALSYENANNLKRNAAVVLISVKAGVNSKIIYSPLNTSLFTSTEKMRDYVKNGKSQTPAAATLAPEKKQPPTSYGTQNNFQY